MLIYTKKYNNSEINLITQTHNFFVRKEENIMNLCPLKWLNFSEKHRN